MKKITGSLFAVSLAIAFVIFGAVLPNQLYAQNDTAGNGIRVSPVRTDVTMNPGESRAVTLTVQNITGADGEFQAVVNDFVAKGEEGQPALILEADEYAPSHSLKRYISEIPNVSVGKGEYKEVKVNITIPKDTAAGGYYGAVRFVTANDAIDKNVTLSASVASIILVRVSGDIVENVTLESLDVRSGDAMENPNSFFTSHKNLYVTARFKNAGTSHEQPFGKVVVKKGDKVIQTTEINNTEPKGNVLPDSVRRFNVKLDKIGSWGKYTVEGNFGYGKSGQLITGKTSFFVLPLPLIVGAIALVAVVIAAIVWVPRAIKRYNANVLRKAGRR
ncbi:hypothetical protein CSA80_00040 [Candidatus Saccharibacteria bacterium]|nr:MAG: hypothetical protein CSA80_00040 [Candidatus Saccharibacteria bacterium]